MNDDAERPPFNTHESDCPCDQSTACLCRCSPPCPQGYRRGPNGGSLVEFVAPHDRVILECFIPFAGDDGETYPFMPTRPTLDKEAIRAITGFSDAWINEHSGFWTSRMPGWEIHVATFSWMADVGFEAMATRDETDQGLRSAHKWARSRAAKQTARRVHARICQPDCRSRHHLQQVLQRLVREYLRSNREPK